MEIAQKQSPAINLAVAYIIERRSFEDAKFNIVIDEARRLRHA